MDFDDLVPKKSSAITIGQELYDLSVEELGERLILLQAEIERVQEEIVNKKSTKSAANSVFKL